MASNKNLTVDSKNTNVQVKKEPGTSASGESMSFLERVRNIKMEPGVPTTTQRLTSFRVPRDLTLGGNIKTEKPKKVYMPNVNVQRNKKKDDATTERVEQARSKDGRGGGGRDRARGHGKTNKSNIIQSVGVWSEGIYMAPTTSRRSESFRDGSRERRNYSEKPKLKLNKVIDKAEEERKLKNLLRDDFIDDGIDFSDEKMNPFLLPRIKKNENVHSDEEIEDKKPIIPENGEVMKKEDISPFKEEKGDNEKISEIFENKTNSYILIQFPDCLPGLASGKEELGLKKPNDSTTDSERNVKERTEYCTLNSLQSGFLGKLEILKSGRARLRFGEKSFFVDAGIQQQFHQELLATKIDNVSLTGDLINLGTVNNKLICSPDLESMLNKL